MAKSNRKIEKTA